jgi:hypothetical protein
MDLRFNKGPRPGGSRRDPRGRCSPDPGLSDGVSRTAGKLADPSADRDAYCSGLKIESKMARNKLLNRNNQNIPELERCARVNPSSRDPIRRREAIVGRTQGLFLLRPITCPIPSHGERDSDDGKTGLLKNLSL